MKIDCFTHVMPPRFYAAMKAKMTGPDYLSGMIESLPHLVDLPARLAVMDRHGIDAQVITAASPPIEVAVADPATSADLARMANDEIAQMAAAHPGRFIPVGTVAMNNPAQMAREAERCLTQLGMKGVLIYSSAAGIALDRPEFRDFFAVMAQHDYPIWLHPARGGGQADYRGEDHSKYWIWQVFGWPYETTAAMTRLVFDGLFDRHPDIKIITHHAGAMAPAFEARIDAIYGKPSMPEIRAAADKLARPANEYFRMFYGDTALMGAVGGLAAAYGYLGPDRLLFGTDTPFDGTGGEDFTRNTLFSIAALAVPPAQKQKMLSGNAIRLMKLNG
jgi:aminocarboxymuconate-semialdehyde decarboxylase